MSVGSFNLWLQCFFSSTRSSLRPGIRTYNVTENVYLLWTGRLWQLQATYLKAACSCLFRVTHQLASDINNEDEWLQVLVLTVFVFASSNLGRLVCLRLLIPVPLCTSPLKTVQNILIKFGSLYLLYLSLSQATVTEKSPLLVLASASSHSFI